jgi:hypothetical protein
MVLYGVIRASAQELGDLLPLTAYAPMRLEQHFIVLVAPGSVVNLRVEMVVPSESQRNYLSRHCLPVLSKLVFMDNF